MHNLAIFSLCWVLLIPVAAETLPSAAVSGRPRIGLVLSGGGALGAAHIGVLKALEEMHVPVDVVAGTSMGSVVGGLYASGLPPEEIERWVRKADWYYLLSDTLPRESESYRTKQRQYDLNQGIALNVNRKGVSLPAGLINGRNIMASLRALTAPVSGVRDLSRLPLPFRAIATDMESGQAVVLTHGDLVDVIRASMSIPAIFTPKPLQGRMLIDGGVTNNLPIDQAQAMGADIIIAVDASDKLKKVGDLTTAPAIANQVVSIFVQNQMNAQLARLGPKDIHLNIYLQDLTAADFVKTPQMIDEGYKQTMGYRSELQRLSIGGEAYRSYLTHQRIPRDEPVKFTFVRVATPAGTNDHQLHAPLAFDLGDRDTIVHLQSVLNDLGELQKWEAIDYGFLHDNGQSGLLIKTQMRKIGPTYFNLGFGVAYSSSQYTDAGFLLSYRMTELNRLGGEWGTFLSVGDSTRVGTEWYQPVDWERRFFFAAQGLFGSDYIDGRTVDDKDPLRFRQQNSIAGLDVGARLWQSGEVRFGYARGFTRISRRLGVPDDVPTSSDRGWLHLDLTWDRLDAPAFATRGSYARVSLIAAREELGASDNYTRIEGQALEAITLGKKNTFLPRVSASIAVGPDRVPLYQEVALGGFLNLSGLSRGKLFGDSSALAELVFYRKIADMTPGLGRGIYLGASAEAGEVWSHPHGPDTSDIMTAGSLFLGADTFLGALYLGAGLTDEGDKAIYLQMGAVFGQGRQ